MLALGRLQGVVELGGAVVALLLGLSVIALAVILLKLADYARLGVGRHAAILAALDATDTGDTPLARTRLRASRSYLAPVLLGALARDDRSDPDLRARFEAEASARLDRLERKFRLLDNIAQVSPLLGLFGTVLGMIEAFRALQEAGSSVDPSLLAGGIWVALMTTAAGLAVAMPAALVLSWFESRVARERALADLALNRLLCPLPPAMKVAPVTPAPAAQHAHAG
ncbi:MAG: MotA/TolQ/ExbB proton channel family protein [Qingshengfaniella sp.]